MFLVLAPLHPKHSRARKHKPDHVPQAASRRRLKITGIASANRLTTWLPRTTLGHEVIRCCHVGRSRFGQTLLEEEEMKWGRKGREEREEEEENKIARRIASDEEDRMPFGHNWHYSPPVGSLANSQHSCQIIATSPLHATPVDRSLVMRALGGAITSPCSNDSECRRPTPAIFGLYPFLLFFCWLVVYLNKLPKRHSLGDC